ncbi:hypothetical protein AB0J52_07370 [Spirillospora sp. NPDC049652]
MTSEKPPLDSFDFGPPPLADSPSPVSRTLPASHPEPSPAEDPEHTDAPSRTVSLPRTESSPHTDASPRPAGDPFATIWADDPEPAPGSFFSTASSPPEQTAFWEADLPSLPRTAPSTRRRSRGLVLTVVGVVAATAGGTLAWALVSQDSGPSPAGTPVTPPSLASTAPAATPSAVVPPASAPPSVPTPAPPSVPTPGAASPTERPTAEKSPAGSGTQGARPPARPHRSDGGHSGGGGRRTTPPSRHRAAPPRASNPRPKPKHKAPPQPKLCPVYDNGVLVAYRPC